MYQGVFGGKFWSCALFIEIWNKYANFICLKTCALILKIFKKQMDRMSNLDWKIRIIFKDVACAG